MVIDQKTYELIDSYLNGELSGSKLQEFEARFISDKSFAQWVRRQKQLKVDLVFYKERSELHEKLDEIHEELDLKQLNSTIFKAIKKKTRIRTFLYTIPAAAAVSIIAVFGVLYSIGIIPKEEPHIELMLKLEEVEKNVVEMKEEKQRSNETVPVKTYTATAIPISRNGYIVTSKHVIEGTSSITIESKTDTIISYHVEVVYIDEYLDIAILRITDTTFTEFASLPFSIMKEEVAMGENVYTLGYPKKDMVYNEGSISSISGYKDDTTSYQISIPINPGNSGGPLLDEKGNIVGIIKGRHSGVVGAAYAIKSSYLSDILDRISADTTNTSPPLFDNVNTLKWHKRPSQIELMKPYVFRLKAKRFEEN